jgi:hypothetical protein
MTSPAISVRRVRSLFQIYICIAVSSAAFIFIFYEASVAIGLLWNIWPGSGVVKLTIGCVTFTWVVAVYFTYRNNDVVRKNPFYDGGNAPLWSTLLSGAMSLALFVILVQSDVADIWASILMFAAVLTATAVQFIRTVRSLRRLTDGISAVQEKLDEYRFPYGRAKATEEGEPTEEKSVPNVETSVKVNEKKRRIG